MANVTGTITKLDKRFYVGETWAKLSATETTAATAQKFELSGCKGRDFLLIVDATNVNTAEVELKIDAGTAWAGKAQVIDTLEFATGALTVKKVYRCESACGIDNSKKIYITATPSSGVKLKNTTVGSEASLDIQVIEL